MNINLYIFIWSKNLPLVGSSVVDISSSTDFSEPISSVSPDVPSLLFLHYTGYLPIRNWKNFLERIMKYKFNCWEISSRAPSESTSLGTIGQSPSLLNSDVTAQSSEAQYTEAQLNTNSGTIFVKLKMTILIRYNWTQFFYYDAF